MQIPTNDGLFLSASLFEPSESAKGIILVCPGLGIPKSFYEKYCQFTASKGYITLIFDYRGIEETFLHSKDPRINLRNWGIHDIPSVLDWLHQRYPNQKIYYFGHSIGGQVAGLIPNHHLIERFFFVSSTTGHPTIFDFPLNIFSWFMYYIHIPITTKLFGYLPKSLTYRGVAIAKGVACEWSTWSKKRDYIQAFLGDEIPNHFYHEITQRIDWIYFADDQIATERAVQSMMDYYTNATIHSHFFEPSKMGLPRIGHAGFFHPKAGKTLWEFPLRLIEE